jgi:hypothetical protein
LDICSEEDECPDLAGGVQWLVEDEMNGEMPDFLDSVYVKLCWSPNSMVAELCLHLVTDNDRVSLIEKGLKMARKADRKMKDEEGKVKLPIAYEIHEPVYTELKNMAQMYGVVLPEHGTISFGTQTSHVDPVNLPGSYLRHNTSSERSNGERTSSRSESSPDYNVTSRRTSSTSRLRSSGRNESSGALESVNEDEEERSL